MSLEVTNVFKTYGNQEALSDVSFMVGKAEIVGFLGPNGAGKSTMMKIITTYLKVTSGRVKVNGFDVISQSKEVQSCIGYLPEHNSLYIDMYVKEYLIFNASLHKTALSRVEEVIELTGLTSEYKKKINQLSKGYKQRVGLAAALLHNPSVLVLDEPTTGLDPNQLVDIRNLIKQLGASKTVFLSTHIMQEVEAMCNRVIIINKGKIVADKQLHELKNKNEQIIVVEFDYRVEEAFLNKLPKVKHVTNVDGFTYEISFTTSKDMRSDVFDFAHDNQLKILQLNQKNANLETLFRELTSN